MSLTYDAAGAPVSVDVKAEVTRRVVAYALALAFGALFFFGTYSHPLSFLAGDSGFFEIGDAPQHVTGWQLYARDDWRWPPLVTQLIRPPEGANIALTDSIPLAALIFKVLQPVLPEGFHYFGLWHLLASMGQAVGAVFLIRSLGRRDLLSAFVAAAMMLMWPAALSRLSHTALTTHAVILLALGVYFRALHREWSLGRSTLICAVLAVVSLLIHPYFLAMVFPLVLALAGDRWIQGKGLAGSAALVLGAAGAMGAVAILFGYASGQADNLGGFSHFSMNLLAPFCGGAIRLCGLQDATGGQAFEGLNYLGAGSFVFLAVAVVVYWRSPRTVLSRRHFFLLSVLIGFCVYSVSDRIFAGSLLIGSYPLPPIYLQLTEIFRASGRFFWPVGYALIFVTLAVVLKQRRVVVLPVLTIALVLQWIDTSDLRARTAAMTNPERPFDYSGWSDFQGVIEHIEIYPTHGCEGIDDMRYLYFQIVAARIGASINTGYLARNPDRCKTTETSEFQPNTLYVSVDPVRGIAPPEAFEQGRTAGICARWPGWGGLVLCHTGIGRNEWKRIDEQLVVD